MNTNVTLQPYTRTNPYSAAIKERYNLTKPGSKKMTQHIVLDLTGSGLTYEVGDSIGVQPVNPSEVVEKMLKVMKATGDEVVREKRSNEEWNLKEYLTKKANLALVSKKLFSEVCERQEDPRKKLALAVLLSEENKGALKEYLAEREVWDFLEENEEVIFPVEELCHLMMPLLPRLYSIASSQMAAKNEVHLTVAPLEYETNGRKRLGVCTHYLCHIAPLMDRSVPVYVQPHKGFTVPEDPNTPIIMVGPGTGIAPFRAFMQERIATNAPGKNWLFFGEWNRAYDFFYEEYWVDLQAQEKLIVDVAFSRDQEHKVYVQHRMLERGAEFFAWLQEGAIFYVCGDAERMAKDVDAALHHIVEEHGKMDEQQAKEYVKQLRKEKRYHRDVY